MCWILLAKFLFSMKRIHSLLTLFSMLRPYCALLKDVQKARCRKHILRKKIFANREFDKWKGRRTSCPAATANKQPPPHAYPMIVFNVTNLGILTK